MSVKTGFDTDFQMDIIRLLHQDFDFLKTAGSLLRTNIFDSEAASWLFTQIRDYYLDYGDKPSKIVLKREIAKGVEAKTISTKMYPEVRDLWRALDEHIKDKEYIIDEVFNFVKHQELKEAIIKSVGYLKNGEFDKIEAVVGEAMKVSKDTMDLGMNYFQDIAARISRRGEVQECIPTGIPDLDGYLRGGGLARKTLTILLAPTSRGKSMALPHFAKAAYMLGFKVAYYTFEMSEDMVAERFDQTFAGLTQPGLTTNAIKLANDLSRICKTRGDNLIIKEYPTRGATVNDVKAHLKLLSNYGFVPDIILVDYGDIMKHISKGDKREQIGDTFERLRGLAGETNSVLVSASQANRGASAKKVVTMEDIAEDYSKSMTADLIVSLSADEEELAANIMRLFIAKNRMGARGGIISINTGFSTATFAKPPRG